MGQVLNVVSDLVVNISASANPNNFSGGQKQYEQMMYRYLYQDCDFSKGLQLLQFAEKKYFKYSTVANDNDVARPKSWARWQLFIVGL